MSNNGLPIHLVNVHKSFGERHIIKGIHLDIRAGEFISVVGRSGCGKSTLLRLLAQLEEADDGQIISDSLSKHAKGIHA
jgi:ABC-type sugar transport system ATPase subunit